ncbi:amino acid adenylation domain-containing protein [Pseudomonas sp. App30]|uniref:amino acid adenylation domain-containing protein n=1 Tax=Pseudomonas sp. App30 TaxID=3068990 RepID=UPI003A809A58
MNQFIENQDDELLALLLAEEAGEPGIPRRPDEGSAPLSFSQQRLWLLHRYDPAAAQYNLPRALRLEGEVDVAALEQAFQALIQRHEVFRTRFVEVDGQPRQVIEPHVSFQLHREEKVDCSQINARIRAEAAIPFVLDRAPLLRATLLSCADECEQVLLFTLHHIVSDAWSNAILVRDLSVAYAAALGQADARLPVLEVQYADYAAWQRQRYEQGHAQAAADYWRGYLGSHLPVLNLPLDHPRPAIQGHRGESLQVQLPDALLARLRAFCQQQACTPFVLLLGAWQALLARHSGQDSFAVGVPNAARNQREIQELVGFFVNTQVYRADFSQPLSARDLCRRLRAEAMQALEYADYPFELLLDHLQVERSLSHSPVFQTLFNLRNQDDSTRLLLPGLNVEVMTLPSVTAKFDLSLDVALGEHLLCTLEYDRDLFAASTIARLAGHYEHLLDYMLDHPDACLDDAPLLGQAEREQLQAWSQGGPAHAMSAPVHRLFEQQAALRPDALAVLFDDRQLTYAQLDTRANHLALLLRQRGVGADVMVGVAAERSPELVVALLAILKAGGAYVPMDPDYPAERLKHMLDDSGITLLLTQARVLAKLPLGGRALDVLDLDALDLRQPVALAPAALDAEHLAYVIYTSGSTGKPKGAGNSHGALFNRLAWMQQAYDLSAADNVLQKTPFSFDVSVWEFFWPLMTGATLTLALPGEHRDPAALIRRIRQQGITTLHFVPSMLQAFMAEPDVARCTSLRLIVCSGEALPADLAARTLKALPNAELVNLYGPTEAAIDVTHWTCRLDGRDSVPIGRPIDGLSTQVLDKRLQPVPIGVAGELYLGGVGLARGYHQRQALTAERFVPAADGSGRLYRTGDLVRWREGGIIEYLGRLDHQVKIRGLRIELGEIEACLLESGLTREAVVLAVDGVAGSQQLVAYVVGDSGVEVPLRAWLAERLPDFMVPAHLISLAQMPLSPNGKLERKALPLPQAQVQAYVAPQGERETVMAGIWQQVLGIEQVGANDNFFELGGDSIIAIQVVSRARQAGLLLAPRDLFQHQTLAALAKAARQAEAPQVEQAPVTGASRLLPFQTRFFATQIAQRQHWNQSVMLGFNRTIIGEHLRQALHLLLEHHDALRLRFDAQGQAQHAAPGQNVLWQMAVADQAELEAVTEQAQNSLDLLNGPLLRAVQLQLWDGSQRLLLVVHHLVVDGVSWRILLEDLQALCRQLADGARPQLPPRTTALRDWAEALHRQAGSAQLAAELPWWQAQLADNQVEQLVATPQAQACQRDLQVIETGLDAERTRQLLRQAPAAYRTQVNDLLLTALARAWQRWSGQAAVHVELEGHGREQEWVDGADLSRTVGWFTSTYPLRLQAASDMGESIKAIKEHLRQVPNRGIGHGVLAWLSPHGEALRALPAPRITFNYLGQFDQSFGDDALLYPAAESSGRNSDPEAPPGNWLSINGSISEGCLRLAWSFAPQWFSAPQVQGLADAWQLELRSLIEHCISPAAGGLTPSDFPLARLTQAQLDNLPVPAAQIEDIYPLSPMQQGILFHSVFTPTAGAYINQLRVDVQGLDLARFRAAWQAALDAHPVLRCGFAWEGEGDAALQIVHRHVSLVLEQGSAVEDAEQVARAERQRGFDLRRPALMRLRLVRLADGGQQLIWTCHHLLLDGWSQSQLLGEVLQRYAGQAPSRSAPAYRDYIQWLGQRPSSESFWRANLGELQEPTYLANLLAYEGNGDSGQAEVQVQLDAARTAQLQAFARQRHVTFNTLVQAAWLLLLHRYSGQATVAFGATVAGRPAQLPGIEQQLGLFINTLPVAATPQPLLSVDAWLAQVQQLNLDLREHEHTPLYDIQRWLGYSGRGLFDHVLVFENYPVSEALQQGAPAGVSFANARATEQSSYPMMLMVNLAEQLHLRFTFDLASFDREAMARLAGHFQHLLLAMAEDAARPLAELQLLGDAERQQLLQRGVQGGPALAAASLVPLFERQAAQAPASLALIASDQTLDYAALNRRANRLARALRASGVQPDDRVAVACERDSQLLVALLAVLKAGAAYVPLDPEFPVERLGHMLADSGARLLLTQQHLLAELPAHPNTWCLDRDQALWADEDASDLAPVTQPQHLAYVIYTSGSTGRPKGVAVSHGALLNFLESMAEQPGLVAGERMLALTSLSFDIAGLELYLPLTRGASVVLVDRDSARDPQRLWAAIEQHQVRSIQATPSTWRMLADHPQLAAKLAGRQVLCGGEALPADLAQRLIAAAGHVWNLYGPTETTIWSARRRLDPQQPQPWLGEPIAHTGLYVLDAYLQPLPQGVAGELFIGGQGLARGYHGRADLTAERFVPDPQGHGRLYRTGDLARWRANGQLEYVGRIDQQVKVRGFRIELGEIEAQLLRQPGVREAAVVARSVGQGQQLVGYVVGEGLDLNALKAALKQQLPDYMVPAQLLQLAAMPLTPNRKLDRKALPAPDWQGQAYQAPEGPRETLLAQIWAQVLGLDKVGVLDNFFELGGDSIVTIQVVGKARQAGLVFSPKALFEQPTVRALAAVVEAVAASTEDDAPLLVLDDAQRAALPAGVSTALPLTPMQHGMLFHQLLDNRDGVYVNQLRVDVEAVDAERLRHAWQAALDAHDSLRTGFCWQGLDTPLQWVQPALTLPLQVLDWRNAFDSQALDRLAADDQARGFALDQPPLLRLTLVRCDEQRYHLIYTHHHILMDGWSTAQLLGEVMQRYLGEAPPASPGRYGDYLRWLQRRDPAATEQFWDQQLAALEAPTRLADCLVKPQGGEGFGQHEIHLPLAALAAFARSRQVTVNTLLQAAWAIVLQRYSGQAAVAFGATVAGRPPELPGIDRQLGLFINTLPVVSVPAPQLPVGQWLQQVQAQAVALREFEHTPLFELQRRHGDGEALFDSLLVFENFPVAEVLERADSPVRFSGAGIQGNTNYPLTLMASLGDSLKLAFNYRRSHFSELAVQGLASQLQTLLLAMLEDPARPLGELPLLDAASQRALVLDCNRSAMAYDPAHSLHQLIEAQAARSPDAVAVIADDGQLTYSQLNARANRLAGYLREQGVGPDVAVGIALERGAALPVALLAVMKAGGAYVPMDPEFPRERLAHMLEDSGLSLLLSERRLLAALPPTQVPTFCMDDLDGLAHYAADNGPAVGHPEHLAYVIYTSGSTGKPKGVAVRQGGLVNFLHSMAAEPGLTAADRVLGLTSLSFDISALELYLPLLVGGAVVLVERMAAKDPARLLAVIEQHGVTVIQATPSSWGMLASHEGFSRLHGKRFFCGGEALSTELAARLGEQAAQLWNLYGPTETTIWSALNRVHGRPDLGGPLANTQLHVLDDSLNPAPPGVAGELYIGGDGLARGYHARPGLTAERFVADPFSASGARLYRTGDLARRRADGVLEYLGRIDQQVKIRGLRIELGEIEACLLAQAGVADAAVVARESAYGKQLVGYVTGVDASRLDALKAQLRRDLPDYMVPAQLLALPRMPLTPNGKLDRKALPAPDWQPRDYVAPRTGTEQLLADIWAQVLGLEQVGVTDNFFELGGHSLLATQVFTRLQSTLQVSLSLRQVFEVATVAELADLVDAARAPQPTTDLDDLMARLEAL